MRRPTRYHTVFVRFRPCNRKRRGDENSSIRAHGWTTCAQGLWQALRSAGEEADMVATGRTDRSITFNNISYRSCRIVLTGGQIVEGDPLILGKLALSAAMAFFPHRKQGARATVALGCSVLEEYAFLVRLRL